MSGHSKWSQIKHKKAHSDKKRGKLFSSIVKEITVAARIGGGDPEGNARLRLTIEKAKEANMPQDNIKRAIMKGTGELPGAMYEEQIYEGYGPGGVALYIEALTDNKNRTVSELRHMIGKHDGALGEAGCVAWLFENRGYILVDKKTSDEDAVMSIALDAGALDMKNEPGEDSYEVITMPEDMQTVKAALENGSVSVAFSEVSMIPKNYVKIEGKKAELMTKLMETLEDHDDVQHVYANFDIPDDVLEKEVA